MRCLSTGTENGRGYDPELRCNLWEGARRYVRKTELGGKMPFGCPRAAQCPKVEPECPYIVNPPVVTIYLNRDPENPPTQKQRFIRRLKGWESKHIGGQ